LVVEYDYFSKEPNDLSVLNNCGKIIYITACVSGTQRGVFKQLFNECLQSSLARPIYIMPNGKYQVQGVKNLSIDLKEQYFVKWLACIAPSIPSIYPPDYPLVVFNEQLKSMNQDHYCYHKR
jgi:hypothetical protein